MLPYGSGKRQSLQLQFGGYNHSVSSGEGQIRDELNMSSLAYPYLRPRRNRPAADFSANYGIFAHDAIGYVVDNELWYDGHLVGYVQPNKKQFAIMGNRIVIWPDKVVLNASYKRLGTFYSKAALEAAVTNPAENAAYGVGAREPYEIFVYNGTEWVSNGLELEPIRISKSFKNVWFKNGTYHDVEADANTMEFDENVEDLGFRVGDAVTIKGCTEHPENNKTAIIREIEGKQIRFYEFVFVLGGEHGLTDYSETDITVTREAPDLDVICAVNNRLWGAKDDTIYASALGNPFNFNVFDGLTTDSWFQSTGTAGRFTGCTMYLGYPMFFKEGHICKIYGSNAENFQPSLSATMGVRDGASQSFAIAGEVLYYLSPNGLTAYTGGLPESLAAPFGNVQYVDCISGTDGRRLYLSMKDTSNRWTLFCLDTDSGLLRKEDHRPVQMWTCFRGVLYGMSNSVEIYNSDTGEGFPDSMVEFGDFTEQSMNRKSPTSMQMRLRMEQGATLQVQVMYDSDGGWRPVKTFTATQKMSFTYPIKLRRCDHYRLRLVGTGYWELQAMSREFSVGSGIH